MAEGDGHFLLLYQRLEIVEVAFGRSQKKDEIREEPHPFKRALKTIAYVEHHAAVVALRKASLERHVEVLKNEKA